MRLFVITLVVLFGALILSGCQGGQKSLPVADEAAADSTSAPIFAETKILTIDSEMMAEEFKNQQLPVTKKIDSTIALNSVYEMLLDTILAKDYESFDLDAHPLLKKQFFDMYNDFLLRLTYQKHIVDSVTVDSAAVQAAYDEYKERFFNPERYRAQHIVISGDNLRHSADSVFYLEYSDLQIDSIARSQVESLRERLLGGANFDTLAIMYSQDPGSADKGGDLGYFELKQMVAPFDSTVEHTPIDSISGVIKTQFGWHVLKVLDKSEEHYSPIDSVYDVLASLVKEKKVAERGKAFIDSIRESGVTIIDTSIFKMDESLLNPDTALAFINPDDKKFGNDTLTYGEFRSNKGYIARQMRMQMPLSLENKLTIAKALTNKYHMYRSAALLGYTEDPELVNWAKQKKLRYAVSTMRKDLLQDGYEPTDEEMRSYYDSHMDEYQVKRPLKVQHIVFADSNLAEHVRDVASSGIEFDALIDQYYPGDPEIKQAAANLGYIGMQDMPEAFWRAANATRVGDISKPVKTEYGYHIIKVLDRNNSIRFESAKGRISAILKEQHKKNIRDTYVEEYIGGPPEIHWDVLDKLHYKLAPPPINPAMMGRR